MKAREFMLLTMLFVLAATGVNQVQAAGGTYEAQLYAITQWTDTCYGGSRSWWDDMGDAWYDEITDSGFSWSFFGIDLCFWGHCDDYFTRDRRWVNGGMSGDEFTEENSFVCGTDRTYPDEGDAVMIATHGGDDGEYWRGLMRYKDCNNDCYINGRDELRVGDFDTEFLHLSSCHSLDDNMIGRAYRQFGSLRLHQLHGFHGCMWIGSSMVNDYEDFAEDAFDTSIASSWMENMYRENINGQYTQCPVAYGVGTTANECLSRLANERYNNVYSDPSDVGYYCYYYYSECDPACESAFGSDWDS